MWGKHYYTENVLELKYKYGWELWALLWGSAWRWRIHTDRSKQVVLSTLVPQHALNITLFFWGEGIWIVFTVWCCFEHLRTDTFCTSQSVWSNVQVPFARTQVQWLEKESNSLDGSITWTPVGPMSVQCWRSVSHTVCYSTNVCDRLC